MHHHVLSLNGTWLLNYREEKYLGTTDPWHGGCTVENAVPGYWEDMSEKFQKTSFFQNLQINLKYCLQQYPISTTAPDMVLPNYRLTFKQSFDYLMKAYKEGVFSEERLNDAVRHVLAAQEKTLKKPSMTRIDDKLKNIIEEIETCVKDMLSEYLT